MGCLLALASGPPWGANLEGLFGLRIVRLAALGWTWCLFYHLANGVRHLVWDLGRGFEPKHAQLSGWFVFLSSLAANPGLLVVGTVRGPAAVSLRTPLGHAEGLGSAGHGTGHWWAQRISAVALVPLAPWFLWRLATLPSLRYEDLLHCFQGLGNATC